MFPRRQDGGFPSQRFTPVECRCFPAAKMAAFPVSVSRRQNTCARALTGKAAVPAARRRVATYHQREADVARASSPLRDGETPPLHRREAQCGSQFRDCAISPARSAMIASEGGWIRVSGLPSARSARQIMAVRPQHVCISAGTDGGARNAHSIRRSGAPGGRPLPRKALVGCR